MSNVHKIPCITKATAETIDDLRAVPVEFQALERPTTG